MFPLCDENPTELVPVVTFVIIVLLLFLLVDIVWGAASQRLEKPLIAILLIALGGHLYYLNSHNNRRSRTGSPSPSAHPGRSAAFG